MVRTLVLIFTFTLAFAGVNASTPIVEPDTNHSVFYFSRPKSYAGSGSRIFVYMNGVEVGVLTNGTKLKCSIESEGVIEIKILSKSPRSSSSQIIVSKHGEEHYFHIWWPRGSIIKMDQQKNYEGTTAYNNDELYKPNPEILFKESKSKTIPILIKDIPEAPKPVESKTPLANGSGFGISDDGYIVTNYHVVKESKFLYVKGVNGDFAKRFKATLAVKDELNDLAILKIEDENFTGWGDSIPYAIKTDLSEVGEGIFVLGYPLTTTMGDEIKLTNGIISSKTGFKGLISLYQISAPVQPGNSGGPLFDKEGNVIGIVAARHENAENVSYAIKSNYLTNLIDLLPSRPEIRNGFSGLNGKSLPEQVKMVKNFIVLIEVH